MPADLDAIFKAYDVRGRVPEQLDTDIVSAIGTAAAEVLGDGADALLMARDMRPSSPDLAAAFAAGVTAAGLDVIDLGLASTDLLYFAAGRLERPGVMFTASHNPAAYNGMKFCRARAVPVSTDTGLGAIRERALQLLMAHDRTPPAHRGTVRQQDLLGDYAAYLRSLVAFGNGPRRKVVVDAGNGMAGLTTPAVFGDLDVELVPLYFELDGTFPNHEANPLEPANLLDLQRAVTTEHADLGLAFDGDADRCFVVDERGRPVSPSAVTALVAARELDKHPGATVLHNLICSRVVPEVVAEHGGVAVRTRVGHSYIKAEMARTGAVFGGEHSAHYYFADFWSADTGMLAALHVLAALSETDGTASSLFEQYVRYAESGELNTTLPDGVSATSVTEALEQAFTAGGSDEHDPLATAVSTDRLDGLTVAATNGGWWFNVRASNTEPLLRLNVEGRDAATMAAVRDRVADLIARAGRP